MYFTVVRIYQNFADISGIRKMAMYFGFLKF